MCLIIANNTTQSIPTEYIELAAENNADGFGVIGKTTDGDVYIAKSLKMAEALPTIRQFEKECAEVVAHFRWATHGDVNETNTHPFQLHGENYLVHNGIVNVPITNKAFSDTWHLVESMKSTIDKVSFETVQAFFASQTLLGNSKFAMLGEQLPLTIVNRKAGTEKDGIWYSNAENFSRTEWIYTTDSYEQIYDAVACGQYELEDLAMLDHGVLTKLCKQLPHEIADIIADGAYYGSYMDDETELTF